MARVARRRLPAGEAAREAIVSARSADALACETGKRECVGEWPVVHSGALHCRAITGAQWMRQGSNNAHEACVMER